jgi:peptide deformylase
VRRLARDMLETMHAASGVGLAAPQVGIRQKVIVVDVGEGPIVVVNPEITAAEGEQVGLEGCSTCGFALM